MPALTREFWRATARAFIEAGAIIFLFYSNLLMGEFARSKPAGMTLGSALRDVVTPANFCIAVVTSLTAHFCLEKLRKPFSD